MKNFYADFNINSQVRFQDPSTPIMEGIIDLHHYIFFFLVIICIFVIWIMCNLVFNFWFKRFIFTRREFVQERTTTAKLFIYSLIKSTLPIKEKFLLLVDCFNKYGLGLVFFSFIFSPFNTRGSWFLKYLKSRLTHIEFLNYGKHYGEYKELLVYIAALPYDNLKKYNFFQFVMYLRILKRRQLLALMRETQVNHGVALEIFWTILPSIILIAIALPSFILLYSIDEIVVTGNSYTYKVIGNQWFWTYELSEVVWINDKLYDYVQKWDSYMIDTLDLEFGDLRLLTVDQPLYVPLNTHIKFLVTSVDVLHSWAVPSLGIKVDAVPGRLNACSVILERPGCFYGQCSEICGVNHAFMPIVIKTFDPMVREFFTEYKYGIPVFNNNLSK